MLDAVHAVSAVILTVCAPVTMVVPPVNTPKCSAVRLTTSGRWVGLAVAVAVAVGVGVALGVGLGVEVAVSVAVGVTVAVGAGLDVDLRFLGPFQGLVGNLVVGELNALKMPFQLTGNLWNTFGHWGQR